MKESAGLLLYKRRGDEVDVLLVHASGNYNRKAPWSIPKGLPDEGESLEDAARRETMEETCVDVSGPLTSLGSMEYKKSRKRVHAFAAAAADDAQPRCGSWEVDRAEFMPLAEARKKIHPDQAVFLDRLEQLLGLGQN